jgi:hypothetical protein
MIHTKASGNSTPAKWNHPLKTGINFYSKLFYLLNVAALMNIHALRPIRLVASSDDDLRAALRDYDPAPDLLQDLDWDVLAALQSVLDHAGDAGSCDIVYSSLSPFDCRFHCGAAFALHCAAQSVGRLLGILSATIAVLSLQICQQPVRQRFCLFQRLLRRLGCHLDVMQRLIARLCRIADQYHTLKFPRRQFLYIGFCLPVSFGILHCSHNRILPE